MRELDGMSQELDQEMAARRQCLVGNIIVIGLVIAVQFVAAHIVFFLL